MALRISEILEEYFPNEKDEVLINPLIFGDFKNALNDDDEIRLYEDYKTYDVLKKIFEDVRLNHQKLIYRFNTDIFIKLDFDGV
jgi:dynein heavy chain